jgi:hypothetical protein
MKKPAVLWQASTEECDHFLLSDDDVADVVEAGFDSDLDSDFDSDLESDFDFDSDLDSDAPPFFDSPLESDDALDAPPRA